MLVARQSGIAGLTLGSDCHSPAEIASDIDACVEFARGAGFSEVIAFAARKPFLIPFEEFPS